MTLTLLNGITYLYDGIFFLFKQHQINANVEKKENVIVYKNNENNKNENNECNSSSDSDNDDDMEKKNNYKNIIIDNETKICKMDIEENITIENKRKKSKKKWKSNFFRYIMFLNFFSFGAYLVYSFNPFFALKFWMNPYDYAFYYTMGNIFVIGSSFFLHGIRKQCSRIFDGKRWIPFFIYCISFLLTFCALKYEKLLWICVFMSLQYLSLLWYGLSYITWFKKWVSLCFD